MKKIFIIFALLLVAFSFMYAYNWTIMNGPPGSYGPNVLRTFGANIRFANERGDLPDSVAIRMIRKWINNDIEFFTIPYGYEFLGKMYYGRIDKDTPRVTTGPKISMNIVAVKDSCGNIVRQNPRGVPVYSKIVRDTLRYEEDPNTINNWITRNNLSGYVNNSMMDLEYTFMYFGPGYANSPQCSNVCLGMKLVPRRLIQIVREPYPVTVYRDSVRTVINTVRIEIPSQSFSPEIEVDGWINSSFTQLYRPLSDSIYTAGIISYNITRNYNAKQSFDLLGGARVRMSISEYYNCYGEIGGGAKDGVGEIYAKIGLRRLWETSLGTFSIGADINPQWWQFVYWTYRKFNIISPTQYSIESRQHKPWVEGINLGAEIKLTEESSYALVRGSFDPKAWNNSLGLEAKTEGNFYGYLLGNYQHFSPDKFVDADSLVFKPKRNNYLAEAKIGFRVKESDTGNTFLFIDGRMDHQEIQQTRVYEQPYLYKYIRTDVGVGVQFPFYWDSAQVMLTYVDIKDGDWKNYGWCLRVIWNIF